jgi:hypothetical protein
VTEVPDLDQLATAVIADAASDDPLDQLSAAARARDELDDLSDALLDRFVEQARTAGSSWSQIGGALGVSKQAAQQRHTTTDSVARRLLGRASSRRGRALAGPFTPRARSSIASAQDAAQHLCHNYIGTEHLLLGLFGEPEGVAARVLTDLGVTAQSIEAAVVEEIGTGCEPVGDDIPLTPRARNVLQHTLREAQRLGHNYIGTEHILLALMAEGAGLAAKLLAAQGVEYPEARGAIVKVLTGIA